MYFYQFWIKRFGEGVEASLHRGGWGRGIFVHISRRGGEVHFVSRVFGAPRRVSSPGDHGSRSAPIRDQVILLEEHVTHGIERVSLGEQGNVVIVHAHVKLVLCSGNGPYDTAPSRSFASKEGFPHVNLFEVRGSWGYS